MLKNLSKFYLSKIDPELAHKIAIKLIKNNYLFSSLCLNQTRENIHQELFNLNFKSPVGLAAGFDKNGEIYNQVNKLGFGFSEIGTITPKPQFGNPKPRVFRLPEDNAIINRLGFPNDGMKTIKKRIESNLPKGICGINIGPNKENALLQEDYLRCFDHFYDVASYVAINISSPNTPDLRLQHKKENISDLIENIRKHRDGKKTKVPILVKVSPDIDDQEIKELSDIFIKKKVDGIILTNTTINNKQRLLSKYKNEVGGLSGKPLHNHSNVIIKKFYKYLKGSIPIIGVGGISDGISAYEKIKSGASLLQLYTSLIYQGPFVANKINKELSNLVEADGFSNISQAIGSNCK